MVKKISLIIVLLLVIFFAYGSAINSVFAAYVYDRDPSGFSIETEGSSEFVSFDISFDDMTDVGLDSSSQGVWGILVKNVGESFQEPTPCLELVSSSTNSNLFTMDLPVDEYILVVAIGYIDMAQCLSNPLDFVGGLEFEYNFDEVVFEVVNVPTVSTSTLSYFFTPVTETATTTCTTTEEVTTCLSEYTVQVTFLDWLQVNLWIIFLLALNTLGIFFSITFRHKRK